MLNEKKLHHLPISIGGGFFSLKLSIISRMNQNLGKEILKSQIVWKCGIIYLHFW